MTIRTTDELAREFAALDPMHPYRGECVICGLGNLFSSDRIVHSAGCLWALAHELTGKPLPPRHDRAVGPKPVDLG